MPYEETSKLSETGTAEFYNGEQFDLHTAAREIAPATEVIRQRNEQLLGTAADRIVDQAVTAYAQEGIAQLEQFLGEKPRPRSVEAVSRAGEWIDFARKHELSR